MSYEKDPRVESIDALPEWQQEICRQVRDIVHAADALENRPIGAGSARAASEARIATDRWLNEGGSLVADAAAPLRAPMS